MSEPIYRFVDTNGTRMHRVAETPEGAPSSGRPPSSATSMGTAFAIRGSAIAMWSKRITEAAR